MTRLLVLFALLALAGSTLMAAPAIVIHKQPNGTCGMPGSDASGNLIFGGIGNIQLIVENANKVMLTCKGSGIENDSRKGQSFKGFACGVMAPDGSFYITTDTSATVSASGKASLKCTVPN